MKKLITFILVIFSITNLYAQDRVTDSLKLLLGKEKTDSGKIKLLIEIGGRFGFGLAKNDSSLWYLQQALNLSKKNNYPKAEYRAEQHIAYYLFQTGNYPEALKLALQNIKKAQKLNDKGTEFFQTRLVMWIYSSIGNYKNALQYGEKLRLLASVLSLNNPVAVPYSAIVYNNLALVYSSLGMLDSALHYYNLFNEKTPKQAGIEMQAFAKKGLGDTYSKMGNYDSAFHFYRMGIPLALQADRIDMSGKIKLSMAALFQKRGELDSAFFYASQSLKDVQNTDQASIVMGADSLLSQLYKNRQQYDSAYKYLQSFVFLNDSLNNQTKITQAQNFSFNETLKQQQIQQAKEDAQQQYKNRIKIYFLAGIILIFLIIAFFLLRNIRNKRKANVLLSKQKEKVESTLSELKSTQKQLIQSEKMASLGELTAGIAHEIQNPLNFVNNFSDVNKELLAEMKDEIDKGNIDEVKTIANDLIENEQKINHHGKRADAIVKGMLQHSRASSGVKEPTDINALTDEYLRLSYHGLRAKDKSFNAEMKTDFDGRIGKINIIPQDIGRVLLNLFNNAFYAVNEQKKRNPDSYEPTVLVTTNKFDDKIQIIVKDNGNGIPQKIVDKIFQPFFTTKPTGEGTGLGLSLAYDIVKAHGGELKVESKDGDFTEFTIELLF